MPRYFFHIESERAHRDDLGEELQHDAAAWQSAVRMLRDLEHGFQPGEEWRLEVCDEANPLFLITLQTRRLR
jgi:hypothetical protein